MRLTVGGEDTDVRASFLLAHSTDLTYLARWVLEPRSWRALKLGREDGARRNVRLVSSGSRTRSGSCRE